MILMGLSMLRTLLAVGLVFLQPAHAHWKGPSDPAMHAWFDSLAAGKGLCCSFADGLALDDPDWGTESVAGADGQSQVVYWVTVNGKKIDVPPEAVVTEPNKFDRAVVWPYYDHWEHTPGSDKPNEMHGVGIHIRCFLPGPQA